MSMKDRVRRPRKESFRRRTKPGAAPGTLVADPAAPKPSMSVLAYGPDGIVEKAICSVEELPELLGKMPVTWVNVDGLGDAAMLRKLGELFSLHPLALEDVLNTHQRPKVEDYGPHLFLIAREVSFTDALATEQFSMFLGPKMVLSFQEAKGDAFDPVRQRVRNRSGRIRELGADYLAYALIDALVDSYFPVLERFGERIELLEEEIIDCPDRANIGKLHEVKRELLVLRRAVWPLRDAMSTLVREHNPLIKDGTRVFFRDCYDHTVQLIDLLETYRELASDLVDLHMSSVSNRLNEVMKVLTIISTIFIPLTFLVGVYGMNFDPDAGPLSMPELRWKYGYLIFWIVAVAIASGLLAVFRRLGWLTWRKRTRPPTT